MTVQRLPKKCVSARLQKMRMSSEGHIFDQPGVAGKDMTFVLLSDYSGGPSQSSRLTEPLTRMMLWPMTVQRLPRNMSMHACESYPLRV